MEFYDQDKDDDGAYVPANLPPVANPVEAYLVSQFLIEVDRKANLMNADTACLTTTSGSRFSGLLRCQTSGAMSSRLLELT